MSERPTAENDAPAWVRCWVCPDRCPMGDCQRDDRQRHGVSESPCAMGCLGHGGAGVCPHCGDWHADDFSCCPIPPGEPQ